jgi:mono/diheme cytochrome c family protein
MTFPGKLILRHVSATGAAALAALIALPSVAGHADSTPSALVQRGEYLARVGDCVACHTAPGGKPFVGGRYMPTPFGAIPTPNITPDKATGIGNWTDDEFYRAMHEGIGRHHEFLYPAFPFPWFTKATRDDVLAIKAFLFSLPPEDAPRKPLKMAFPFSIREGLLAWRTAFFTAGTFVPNPKQSDQINRGEYLVQGLAHCGECHNREDLYGNSNMSGRLEGGEIMDWYAPNLTSNNHEGLGNWSEDQIVTFLKTGAAPSKGVALGPMRDTIDDSLSHLTDADLRAMAVYLKSVGAKASYKPAHVTSPAVRVAGAQIYLSHCASCHQPDGKGVPGMIPALAGNGLVRAKGSQNVIRVVLGGLNASHDLAPMPAVGVGLTDEQIADVVNYVRGAWRNAAPADAEPGTVGKLRADTHSVLAGNPIDGCPRIADPKLAKVIDDLGVPAELKGVELVDMLDRIDAIVPKIKAARLEAVSDDDIVNALTVAYCPIVLSRSDLPVAQRSALLGDFSGLVYGRVKNGAKQN